MHSRASDGAHSPAEVVEIASSVGVEAIALTDHDTLAGLPEAVAAGERLGVRVITGVELSAMDGADEVHILGLHLARTQDMELTLADFRERRVNRAEQMVERLNMLGIPVQLESVLALSGGGAIGRPHLARALVDGGWVRDSREAFDRYLGNGRPASVPKARIGIRDAIQLIHQAGGLAVWAHPGSMGKRARLEQLRALGMDGVEVRHPGHAAEDMTRLKALADHLDLVPSGGSDWHGALDGPRTMGAMHVPAEWLELQEARLRARAA
jgi:3',5'-nucleoside bisphosphate phosphatase